MMSLGRVSVAVLIFFLAMLMYMTVMRVLVIVVMMLRDVSILVAMAMAVFVLAMSMSVRMYVVMPMVMAVALAVSVIVCVTVRMCVVMPMVVAMAVAMIVIVCVTMQAAVMPVPVMGEHCLRKSPLLVALAYATDLHNDLTSPQYAAQALASRQTRTSPDSGCQEPPSPARQVEHVVVACLVADKDLHRCNQRSILRGAALRTRNATKQDRRRVAKDASPAGSAVAAARVECRSGRSQLPEIWRRNVRHQLVVLDCLQAAHQLYTLRIVRLWGCLQENLSERLACWVGDIQHGYALKTCQHLIQCGHLHGRHGDGCKCKCSRKEQHHESKRIGKEMHERACHGHWVDKDRSFAAMATRVAAGGTSCL